ncbi:hypothetical protein TRICI_003751 [Trichomonascus ciferrii]|uniref:Uncharacterized protein n=1 Tax=Trichomonascus ciferrii TaxID=44093 RepID=A0A642V312_9ASCO|nr:hypothetical protein TRICI_003751 [Trichomonascus ciferrii]
MNIWRLCPTVVFLWFLFIAHVSAGLFGRKPTPSAAASPGGSCSSGYCKGENALVVDTGIGSSAATPPSRTIDHWKLADFLLVGTIDGSLHARDRQTGMELWSIPGESPLVTVSSAEVLQQDQNLQDESEITWIVEPLGDGILYYFMPSTGLHRLPVSIKQLVLESPFAIHGDDKIYTGSRQTTLYSINASTGAIIKVYGDRVGLGKAECKVRTSFPTESMDFDYDDDDEYFHVNDGEENGTFMIGRTGKMAIDTVSRMCYANSDRLSPRNSR